MTDLYTQIANNPIGKQLVSNLGLPRPLPLQRYEPGQPVTQGRVLLGAAPGGRLAGPIAQALAYAEADVATPLDDEVRTAAAQADLDARVFNPQAPDASQRFGAIVFDATGIKRSPDLHELWAFFSPTFRKLDVHGRVVVLGTPPAGAKDPKEATAQRALEGFTRSLAKEARGAATAQLVYVAAGAEQQLESTLRFLLSRRSAFVSGQVVTIGKAAPKAPKSGFVTAADWETPLAGKVALVTGAARGIGESIAEVLARDGAHVVGLDVPALEGELHAVTDRIDGTAIAIDITDEDAPERIAAILRQQHGGVDIVVNNAGVTRDKTLGRMDAAKWDVLMAINLTAPERIVDELIEQELLRPGGRVIGLSSMNGIAGQSGQTNYATSKAGVIGMTQSLAKPLAKHGVTINAVAPGFIETAMTKAMPVAVREAGRRMNSLSQGGLPVDVAETIAWLASPASSGITGNVIRVDGQHLIGA